MKNSITWVIFLALFMIIFSSCQKDIEKYERPEWLAGKLFTQIEAVESLDSFAICVKLSGLDTIINVSGSFTVFAPTNQAFEKFFQESLFYSKVSDIPKKELIRLVKYHIIQNSWTIPQLMALDIYGWIDPDDPLNNQPRGYKRQTLLQDNNKRYNTLVERGQTTITDSVDATGYRMVFTPSRKYAPLFFDSFLSLAGITGNDYEFFFDGGYASGRMHFAGARVIESEIYADNGIIYKIDEVIVPLKNAEDILQTEYNDYSYSDYLDMIYRYGRLNVNMVETARLPGFAEGMNVDTLYDLTFPDLTFNIHSELTNPPNTPANFSIRFQNGLLAPTNQALDNLFAEVVTGPSRWPNVASVPSIIYRIIINSHMANSPVYQKDIDQGFRNGEEDIVRIDPGTVIHTEYGSNSTFIGLNKAIVPRAFSSVAGPVYLQPGYTGYRNAMELAKILPAIKRENENFSLFIVPDAVFGADSSLFYMPSPTNPDVTILRSYDRGEGKFVNRNRSDMIIQLFNHVGTDVPTGAPRREFIPNMAGNYIVFDWENNLVTGGTHSLFGYNGDSVIFLQPQILDVPADNGITYTINGWLNFPKSNLYSIISSFSEFFKLLEQADMVDKVYFKLKFITEGEAYTVFIPSNEALLNYDTSNMTNEELRQFIRYHFIKGDIIFTDGKKLQGQYSTLRVDESSTTFATRFTNLSIKPGIDFIDILNPDGSSYYRINEEPEKTNILASEDSDPSPTDFNYITIGTVHVIDTILVRP
jgi:uncharacterized surface protein with fasciclin (FAS1) repeats